MAYFQLPVLRKITSYDQPFLLVGGTIINKVKDNPGNNPMLHLELRKWPSLFRKKIQKRVIT